MLEMTVIKDVKSVSDMVEERIHRSGLKLFGCAKRMPGGQWLKTISTENFGERKTEKGSSTRSRNDVIFSLPSTE